MSFDRITISENESGSISYTFADEDGVIVATATIPLEEWNQLKTELISSYERDESDWSIIDYMAALADLAETC